MDRPIEIFFSYAHEDEALMDDVRRQLIVYERNGLILKWHDRQIVSGADWRGQLDERLEAAQIILLFISPHFIESQYRYEIEGESALRRRESKEAEVIPIILRPCAWQETPFGGLQALPRGAVSVSRWADRDEACLNVATGVMAAVDRVIEERNRSSQTSSTKPIVSPSLPPSHPTPESRASTIWWLLNIPPSIPTREKVKKLIWRALAGTIAGLVVSIAAIPLSFDGVTSPIGVIVSVCPYTITLGVIAMALGQRIRGWIRTWIGTS